MKVGKEGFATGGKKEEQGALFDHENLPTQPIHRHSIRHAHPATFAAAKARGTQTAAAVRLGAEGVCAGGTFSRAGIVAMTQEVLTFATESLTGKRKANRGDAAMLAGLVAGRLVHGDPRSGRVVR